MSLLSGSTDLKPGGIQKDFTYTGVVVGRNDPDKRGRCQVRIEGLNDDVPVEDLPWAKNCLAWHSEGASPISGAFSVPRIGSKVGIRFPTGDRYSPEMVNHDVTDDTRCEEVEEDYPDTHLLHKFSTTTSAWYNALKLVFNWRNNRDWIGKNKLDATFENGRSLRVVNGKDVYIVSAESIKLEVGASSIELLPDRIVLKTPLFEGIRNSATVDVPPTYD